MRYINIIDISEYQVGQSYNARMLYLELCCRMDSSTRNVCVSIRALSRELPINYNTLRSCLDRLIESGLIHAINVADNGAKYSARYGANVTHLHIMSFNELQHLENATIGATNSATIGATNSATIGAQNQLINNNYKYNITLSHVRETLENFDKKRMAAYIDCAVENCALFISEFLEKMEMKQKSWSSESDALGHFLDWAVKNKKRILKNAEPREKENAQIESAEIEERPHPSDKSLAEWDWICRTVASGSCAPMVLEEYEKGMAELRTRGA